MAGTWNNTKIGNINGGTKTRAMEDCEDTLRQKENLNIIDETKVESGHEDEVQTTDTDSDDDTCSLKGNINIIDETKVDNELKEKREETNIIDSDEDSNDENKLQSEAVQKSKEKIITNDSLKEHYKLNFDDSVTDSDSSLEKGNETCNERIPLDQTPAANTNKLFHNVERNRFNAARKPGDNKVKIKTAVESLKTALDILEKKAHTLKAPLGNCVTNSSTESTIQAETARYIPSCMKEAKIAHELENPSASSVGKSSNTRSYPCNFCNSSAKFSCKHCKYFYCIECHSNLHPNRGPFKSHQVIPITGDVVIEKHETCKDHGLVAQLFCSYCEQERCAECANTKCFLHFKGRVSSSDIDREKTLLVEELERATTKLAFIGRYKEFVENECDEIEMTALLRKEQIRQEFVSFHDLLINKEAEMLRVLDQDVQERTNHVRDTLQPSVLELEMEDALLTTTVTDLVQSEDDNQFIEECVKAKELCSQVDDKISKFNRDWAKNSKYSRSQVLDRPFSMLTEKKQLIEKLNSAASLIPEVRFVQTTLFLYAGSEPWHISDFLHIPIAPPSTEVEYTLQLSTSKGKIVYQKEVKDLMELSLNTEETVKFEADARYLVKISPIYKYITSTSDQFLEKGNSAHMLIVVGRKSKKDKHYYRPRSFPTVAVSRACRLRANRRR